MRILELFFIAALLFYSASIWSHKIKGKLCLWMMIIFGAGLAFDILGTVLLCAPAAQSWKWTLHTASGLISLLIMALHFIWAVLAVRVGGKFGEYFTRFSVPAWSLWLIAFVSGIPYISE